MIGIGAKSFKKINLKERIDTCTPIIIAITRIGKIAESAPTKSKLYLNLASFQITTSKK